jgi:hypothetical protein
MNNNPIETYLKLLDYIRNEDGRCRYDVKIRICRGSIFFATDDQLKHSQERVRRMLYRITRELQRAGIDPKTLFPQGDEEWYWDAEDERIMYRDREDRTWPDIESLLKHIRNSFSR